MTEKQLPSEKYRLTVIVTTCNRVRLLRRCLHSIFMQPFVREVIVVDDNSSDTTMRYIRILKRSVGKLVYIRNEFNRGACYSRNVGIENANSTYITFVDDDDYLLPDRFGSMLELFKSKSYSFISSGRLADLNYGEIIKASPGQFFGDIFIRNISMLNQIDIGFIAEKRKLLQIGGFDPSLPCFHDWDIVIRLINEFGSGFKINKFSYVVNERSDLTRITNKARQRDGFIAIKVKHGSKIDKKSKIILNWEIKYRTHRINLSDFSFIADCFMTRSLRPVYLFFKKYFNLLFVYFLVLVDKCT